MKLPSPVPLAHWAGFQFQIQLDLPNLLGLKASKLFVCCSSHPPKKCRCQWVDLDLSILLTAACIQKILIVSAHLVALFAHALGGGERQRPWCIWLTAHRQQGCGHVAGFLIPMHPHHLGLAQCANIVVCGGQGAGQTHSDLGHAQRANTQQPDDGGSIDRL